MIADSKQETMEQKPIIELVRKTYKGIVMMENEIEDIEKMHTREDDIWVCSFPRSGTTMTQELVYLVETLDFDKATSAQLDERFPIIDIKDDRFPYFKGLKTIENMSSPRLIKCHLHHFLLPEELQNGKGRIIYIARNPKDVVVSFYRLFDWGNQLTEASFDKFFETFVNGTEYACPWPMHVLEYWERRNEKQVLFLKYEDVVTDMPKAVRQIAGFLNKELTDEDVQNICKHCHVDSMRANNMVNLSYIGEITQLNKNAQGGFINKGKVGEWRNVLNTYKSSRIDEMMKELDGSGLTFDSE